MALILGIETSCDETAAALVTRDGEIAANVVASQADLHAAYGGVVPEVASRRPLVPVNHLHGHVASLYLKPLDLEPPFTCLLASGGHTMLLAVRDRSGYSVLGTTLDDAAGEAFDKGARLLGLGYPGGRQLDELAKQ